MQVRPTADDLQETRSRNEFVRLNHGRLIVGQRDIRAVADLKRRAADEKSIACGECCKLVRDTRAGHDREAITHGGREAQTGRQRRTTEVHRAAGTNLIVAAAHDRAIQLGDEGRTGGERHRAGRQIGRSTRRARRQRAATLHRNTPRYTACSAQRCTRLNDNRRRCNSGSGHQEDAADHSHRADAGVHRGDVDRVRFAEELVAVGTGRVGAERGGRQGDLVARRRRADRAGRVQGHRRARDIRPAVSPVGDRPGARCQRDVIAPRAELRDGNRPANDRDRVRERRAVHVHRACACRRIANRDGRKAVGQRGEVGVGDVEHCRAAVRREAHRNDRGNRLRSEGEAARTAYGSRAAAEVNLDGLQGRRATERHVVAVSLRAGRGHRAAVDVRRAASVDGQTRQRYRAAHGVGEGDIAAAGRDRQRLSAVDRAVEADVAVRPAPIGIDGQPG